MGEDLEGFRRRISARRSCRSRLFRRLVLLSEFSCHPQRADTNGGDAGQFDTRADAFGRAVRVRG